MVARDAEYRLREVVHEAVALMHRAKRRRLSNDDVSNALRLLQADVQYGCGTREAAETHELDDEGSSFMRADPDVALAELARAPLPPYPRTSALRTHWLAVTCPTLGVNCFQPLVAENPSDLTLEPNRTAPAGASFDRVDARSGGGGGAAASSGDGVVVVDNDGRGGPPMEHVLSKEMFAYYRKVVATLRGGDAAQHRLLLRSLGNDPGPQQLVPYFAQMIPAEVSYVIKRGREAMAAVEEIAGYVNKQLPLRQEAAPVHDNTHIQTHNCHSQVRE